MFSRTASAALFSDTLTSRNVITIHCPSSLSLHVAFWKTQNERHTRTYLGSIFASPKSIIYSSIELVVILSFLASAPDSRRASQTLISGAILCSKSCGMNSSTTTLSEWRSVWVIPSGGTPGGICSLPTGLFTGPLGGYANATQALATIYK